LSPCSPSVFYRDDEQAHQLTGKAACRDCLAGILLTTHAVVAGFALQTQCKTQTALASGPILFTDCDNSMNGIGSYADFSVDALRQARSGKNFL
jgi:hypothetical protein